MRILIFNWRDIKHPLSGGAEISLLEHAKFWHKKGVDITWFSSSFPGAKREEIIDGIRYIRKGSHFTVHFWAFIYYLMGKFDKPDIIIDSFHFLPFFTPIYFRNTKKIALINEVAGKVWFSNLFFPLNFLGYLIEPYFFWFYKKIPFITASESAKKELVRLGISSSNIAIVPHGVIIKQVKVTKQKAPTLIFLSRVSKDKGIEDAIKAFMEIRQKIKDIQFWVVGKEEKKGYLNSLLKSYNLNSKSIKYFGFVSEKKKFELLKRAWILIHPSQKEGWGLNVIEAASQGTPTVGYNVEGLRDSIVDGKTGILVNPNSIDLEKEIEKLLLNKELLSNMSNEAMKWADEFDWGKSSKQSWEALKKSFN